MMAAAAVYFGWVFAAGFVLGALRVPFVVPRIGERHAELLEMPLMGAALFVAAGHVVRRYGAAIAGRRWLGVGAVALILLLLAETLVAVVLAGRSVGSYIASRDPVSGSVYLVLLLVLAVMPWLRRGQGRR